MSFLVTHSETPLFFDALPALKVRYYKEAEGTPNIYSYARFFLLKGQLALSLYSFEKQPASTSCIAFAIQGPPHLLVEARPEECCFYKIENETKTSLPLEVQPSFFAGQDEQGWYWGTNMVLPASFLSLCGKTFAPENSFAAAVLKYNTQQDGFGCSYPVQNPNNMLDFNNFTLCNIVSY